MNLELISPEGTRLDLFPDARIQFNLVNSAFDSEVLKGSFTYTFSIPASATNRKYFGFTDQMSSNAGYQSNYTGFKLKTGVLEMLCRVNIRSVSTDVINITLYTGSAMLADDLKLTRLRDLDFGTVEIDPGPYYNTVSRIVARPISLIWVKIQSGATSWLHGYRYNDPIPLEEAINLMCQRVNRKEKKLLPEWNNTTSYVGFKDWVYRLGKVYNCIESHTNIDPDTDPGLYWEYRCDLLDWPTFRNSEPEWDNILDYDLQDDPRDYLLVPINGHCFYTPNSIISKNFTTLGANITDYTQDIARVLYYMFQRAWEDPAIGDVKVFPIRDEKFLEGQIYNGFINYWRDGGFVNEAIDADPAKVKAVFVPMLRMAYIFDVLHDYLGVTAESTGFLEKDFFKTLVVYSNYAAERITLKDGEIIDRFAYLFEKASCTPDITLAEFLNGIRGFFFMGAWFDYFQKRVVYKPLKDVLVDFENAIDLTHLVSNFDEITFSDPEGFELLYTHDGSDSVSSQQLKIIDNEQVVEIDPVANVSALPTDEEVNRVSLVQDEEKYYISYRDANGDLAWKDWALWLQNLKIGEGKTVIAPKCATLPNYIGLNQLSDPFNLVPEEYDEFASYYSGDYLAYEGQLKRAKTSMLPQSNNPENANNWQTLTSTKWRVPYAGMDRKSTYFQKNPQCSLRLLSYAGVVQNPERDVDLDIYPLATCDINEALGEVAFPGESGGSLRWDGEYGIYQQFAKSWLDFLGKSKQTTIQIPMTESLLNKLKPWLLVKIRGHYFLWSNITVDFPINKSLAKITIHRI